MMFDPRMAAAAAAALMMSPANSVNNISSFCDQINGSGVNNNTLNTSAALAGIFAASNGQQTPKLILSPPLSIRPEATTNTNRLVQKSE